MFHFKSKINSVFLIKMRYKLDYVCHRDLHENEQIIFLNDHLISSYCLMIKFCAFSSTCSVNSVISRHFEQ